MFRALLTLWYTLTVLIGPALCRCTARAAASDLSAAQAKVDAKKPAKSCCCPTEDAGPGFNSNPAEPSKHKTPADCPCKHQPKPDQDRPAPLATSGAEASSQSRAFDAGWADAFTLNQSSTTAPMLGSSLDSSGTPLRVSGRDLLAAFHILRC